MCASTWVRIGLPSCNDFNYFNYYLIKVCAAYAFPGRSETRQRSRCLEELHEVGEANLVFFCCLFDG